MIGKPFYLKRFAIPAFFAGTVFLSLVVSIWPASGKKDGIPMYSVRNHLADTTIGPQADVIQSWAGTAINDWSNASNAVVITDLTRARPLTAFSDKLKKHAWKVMPYEMRNTPPGAALPEGKYGYKGKMVWAGPDTEAPMITLPLAAEGWYAIFVGVYTGCKVWLKLTSDVAPLERENGIRDYYANTNEVFFKVAKLHQDDSLQIIQQAHGFTGSSGVTHIKLIPLTQKEIMAIIQKRNDESHRTMAFSCDGFSFIYARSPRTKEELLAELEPFRNTDFGTLLLHSTWGGDKVAYPSKVGYMPGAGMDAFTEIGHRYFKESVEELAAKHINPMEVLIKGAHEMGMKVHVGMRPAGWSFLEPYADFWETPFFRNHPQWQCRDRDGTPVTRMSWAVPEVRQHALALLKEQIEMGADGAHLVFNRGFPLMLYEEPFCRLFKEKYGLDATKIEESDARIINLRADIVLEFFKGLRHILDREAIRRGDGKRLVISASVLGTEEDNLQYGVDIRRLVEAGLLDAVYIYPYDFGATKKGGFDLAFFREVCTPKGVPFFPALATHWDIDKQIEQAFTFLEEGASGIYIWDAGGQGPLWQPLYFHLGHQEEVRRRSERVDFKKPPRNLYYFHKLGNKVYDGRFPAVWGG